MNWIKLPRGKRRVAHGHLMGAVLALAIMLALAAVPYLLAYAENLPVRPSYVELHHGVLDGMEPCDGQDGTSDVYPCYWDVDAHEGRHGLGTPRYVLFYGPDMPYEWWGGREQ